MYKYYDPHIYKYTKFNEFFVHICNYYQLCHVDSGGACPTLWIDQSSGFAKMKVLTCVQFGKFKGSFGSLKGR
jgi:hypothetical protein